MQAEAPQLNTKSHCRNCSQSMRSAAGQHTMVSDRRGQALQGNACMVSAMRVHHISLAEPKQQSRPTQAAYLESNAWR